MQSDGWRCVCVCVCPWAWGWPARKSMRKQAPAPRKNVRNVTACVVAICAIVSLWFAGPVYGRPRPALVWRARLRRGLEAGGSQPYRAQHARVGLYDVPADLCHHRGGAGYCLFRGAHAVFGHPDFHRDVGGHGLCSDCPLDLGVQWLVGWLAGWLAGWLVGWLVGADLLWGAGLVLTPVLP